jgi:hypothetical protein
MYRAGRTAWGLVAIGAATAVGITTRDPGFIIITFLGALVVPRVLGLSPRRWNRRGFGPGGFGPRGFAAHGKSWGDGCSGAGHKTSEPEASTAAPQSV